MEQEDQASGERDQLVFKQAPSKLKEQNAIQQVQQDVDRVMSAAPCAEQLPVQRENKHGHRDIIPDKMIGEECVQIQFFHRLIFKYHFRIIPADVAKEEKFNIAQ